VIVDFLSELLVSPAALCFQICLFSWENKIQIYVINFESVVILWLPLPLPAALSSGHGRSLLIRNRTRGASEGLKVPLLLSPEYWHIVFISRKKLGWLIRSHPSPPHYYLLMATSGPSYCLHWRWPSAEQLQTLSRR